MIILSVSPVFAQYYKDYPEEQKKKLAEAYYLVGKQFQSLGKSNYKNYLDTAYIIYPNLVPGDIQEEPETNTTIIPIQETGQENQKNIQLINYRFKRIITYFLSKDISNMVNFLDSAVYVEDIDNIVTRKNIAEGVQGIYKNFNTAGMTFEQLYDTNAINVAAVQDNNSIYLLTAKAVSMALKEFFSFWNEEQQYYWHKDLPGNWVIFAINKLPEDAEMSTGRAEAEARENITAAFKACLGCFISEDLPCVAQYLVDSIEIIPLNSTISKDEIEYTFSGYFEESGKLEINNTDDLISNISVNYNEELSGKYQDQVYVLEIEINSEYTPQISFWASYKKYYFIKSESGWQIKAIG